MDDQVLPSCTSIRTTSPPNQLDDTARRCVAERIASALSRQRSQLEKA